MCDLGHYIALGSEIFFQDNIKIELENVSLQWTLYQHRFYAQYDISHIDKKEQ